MVASMITLKLSHHPTKTFNVPSSTSSYWKCYQELVVPELVSSFVNAKVPVRFVHFSSLRKAVEEAVLR
ncbi:hypothetical protein CC1G_15088 [Coprinopsis cinerea okayama7|uniref:Uncharacterized protein n=1 Tax=Coprinopsis cinerea (strain Okayama-7 / 130 / ATCC MYA-4618 / FGSC 9003) TaxID=240176 RepID=D6RPF5_COPC7|nr:hypothetical protein CC1G_15088 [Coprinopsis cinerea okayama7\|eukprot:XP_002910754.1 hypothetical protein CC1G_15088 [Coprinopsis cinerea okayama7\